MLCSMIVTYCFFRAVFLLNQKRKMISSTIPAIRRKEMAPRTPPMIAVESVDRAGVDVGSEAKNIISKKTAAMHNY